MAILSTEDVMKTFSISKPTVLQLFAMKGSPAFKVGTGRGHWRVEEDKFVAFLQKQSEKCKS